jgi:MFS transporter, DHA1 family, tetracycline resistance protein
MGENSNKSKALDINLFRIIAFYCTKMSLNDNILSPMTAKVSSPKVLIFLTVFLYLLGFGIIIPILPLLGKDLGGAARDVGLLMAIYSFMQFLFAPFWGGLSDRLGRRKILVWCLLGEVFTYIWFAFSRDFWSLFAARMFAGIFGASISTASAYMSDITPPNERSKGMALIGAAFGLGFVFGPAIGGTLIILASRWSADPLVGTTFTSLFVAGICLVTFIFAYFKLPESLPPEKRGKGNQEKKHRLKMIFAKLKLPILGSLFATFFFASFSMALMESTLVLYVNDKFGWSSTTVSYGFAFVGVMIVFTQGFLVRKLIPRVGERKMIPLGLTMMGFGFLGIHYAQDIWSMALTMAILSIGNGLTNPSVLGAISLASSDTEQGVNLGVTQSMASIGRILGPLLGGYLLQFAFPGSPFVAGFLFAMLGVSLIFINYRKIPDKAKVAL